VATDESYSIEKYCQYVQEREPLMALYKGEILREKVIDNELAKQSSDIFFRVYIDRNADKSFVFGWLTKEDLLNSSVILKRMPKKDKSEKALYFAQKLIKVKRMVELSKCFENKKVYANPYTSTDFYHSTPNCKYLKKLSKDEIIVFSSEEEAKHNGRYTTRCKECFGKRTMKNE
jgi:hypothetical protein